MEPEWGEIHTRLHTSSLPVGLLFHAKQENAMNRPPSNGLRRMTELRTVDLEVISVKQLSVC